MTDKQLIKRQEVWDRIWKMKISKDTFMSPEKMEKWEKQSLPGEIDRGSDLKLKNPSKVRKGDTWGNIQTAISLTVDQKPEIQFIAAEEDDVPKNIIFSNILDYLWDKNKGDIELYYAVLSAVRYGTGIMKCFYKADRRKIKDIELYNPETGEFKFSETTRIEFNDIAFETVPLQNFFPDNRAMSMKDAIDCFERQVISMQQFKLIYDIKRYHNTADVIANQGWFYPTQSELKVTSPFSDYTTDKVEIITYYNKFDDERIIYANGVEIEYIPIPYRHKQLPYARCIFFPKGKEYFWGIGIPELLEHNQAALDTLFNIMIDREKLSLRKPILVGGGEDYNTNIKIEPGQMISVADATNYKELMIDPINNSHINFLDYIAQDGHRMVGADDPMNGVKSGGTATENAIAKEASLNKMKIFLRMLEGELMYDLGRMIIANIQQFYSEPIRVVKITGGSPLERLARKIGVMPKEVVTYRKLPLNIKKVRGEFQENLYERAKSKIFEVTPDDISGNFEVRVIANSSIPVSRELEVKKWQDTIAILSGSPLVKEVNWTRIGKILFDLMNTDSDQLLVNKQGLEDALNNLAMEENIRMMAGEDIPPTQGATQTHTLRHQALLTSTDYDTLEPDAKKILHTHIEGELKDEMNQQSQANNPAAPIQNTPNGVQPGAQGAVPNATAQQVGVQAPQTQSQPNQQVRL